ncbi:MAG: hypothetical protein OQL06_11740 [Gammaproteobacteria bacterium]|nr:hypothetical protein [Gammaproteobacteria bacterium]
MKQISLLIPGLLGPLPELEASNSDLPQCAALQRWLTRGSKTQLQVKTYFQQLAQLFDAKLDYSVTQLSALADGCDCSQGYWYRADPVHFKTDIDHAILLDQHQLNVLQHEAEILAQYFNQHFVDDGLRLVPAHPHRWYLHCEQKLELTTTPLADAVGRDIKHFLPAGEHALNWRRLLNETQMLFHTNEINEQREASRQLTINSLWLWGEGEVFQAAEQVAWDWVMSNEPVASGMAIASHCQLLPFNNYPDSLVEQAGHGLLVIDDLMGPLSYGDVSAWSSALEKMCTQWIEPLNQLLTGRQLEQINLYSGDGRCYKITASKLKKFWLRPRPIKHFISCHA